MNSITASRPVVRAATTLLAAALTTCALLLLPSTSDAASKLKIATKIQQNGAETRILVSLSSRSRLSAKKKPRSVSVRAAGKTVKLSRVAAAGAAAGYKSSWRSAAFTGAYATALQGLNGKSVKVTVKSRSGKTVRSSKAALEVVNGGSGGGGGGATTPLFAAPGRDLTGNEAFTHLSPYFLNSAFSDCAAGPWPNCAVEERYVHCPTGYWLYQRTSGTGADINSPGSFTITGANVSANGAWAVSYDNSYGANYVWQVSTTGVATGQYYHPSEGTLNLGPLLWSQPAVTWNYTSGAC